MRFAIVALLVTATPAWAADSIAEPNLLGSALKMVAALAVIIGILLLVYAASKKGFAFLPQKKGGLIKVIETRPLGGRKFLCIVKVRDEELLLGLSNDRIECLSKLTSVESFSDSLQQAQGDQS